MAHSISTLNKCLHVISCGRNDLYNTDINELVHANKNDFCIIYVVGGTCFVTEKHKTYTAPGGSVIIYQPHEHREYTFNREENLKFYYIFFNGSECHDLIKLFGISDTRTIHVKDSASLENSFQSLVDEFRLKLPYYEHTCSAYLLNILSLIGRKIQHVDTENKNTRMREICLKMQSQYYENLSISSYADSCNLSESRFSHLFKEEIGCSPIHYLINIKIEKAKELLIKTDLTVSQISEAVGMRNQNYFSRIFKKQTSQSPTEYKAAHRSDFDGQLKN